MNAGTELRGSSSRAEQVENRTGDGSLFGSTRNKEPSPVLFSTMINISKRDDTKQDF